MKAIPKLPATSWQQWLDKGMVTFDVTDGPQPPMEEGELSTSRVSGQSASDEVQKRDDYEGPQQLNPICSPARSVNRSPIGSVHSHRSSRSNHGSQVLSVSSATRRQYEEQCIQYEEQIQKLKDELKEKNALLTERSDENRKQYSEILERRGMERNHTRHEELLVGRLNEEKQQVSDLKAHVKQQEEIWRSKVRDYELQVAAINEHQHQKAETCKLEIEVRQHGQGIQHDYKMDKKPQEHRFQVKSQPQQMKKLKDEPEKGGYGNMKEMVKKQEAEYRKKGMEQKKTFQDQLSHKVVHKQPVKQEPKVHREDMHQRQESHDQFSSEEDSDGGTETPSGDSEEESEDTHHRLKSVLREKALDNRYNKAEEQKQSVNQQDPGYADDLIMKRYMSDADDKQSLPYGPDHWSSDAVTPTRQDKGPNHRQDNGNNHQHSYHRQHPGKQYGHADKHKRELERQFCPQWQEPPKPTRVTNAHKYHHQGWKNTLPQNNRTRKADQQSDMGSSYSGESGQSEYHHHHSH